MTKLHTSISINPRERRYTLTFKTDWEQHSMVQEIASKTGKSIADTCCELLGFGIESFYRSETTVLVNPKVLLFRDLGRARERKHILDALAELKPDVSEKEFQAHCREFGVQPDEVLDYVQPEKRSTKNERCATFLRLLFTDRPAGLAVNRVLEIAAVEGFGENLTRQLAKEASLNHEWRIVEGTRMAFWVPTTN